MLFAFAEHPKLPRDESDAIVARVIRSVNLEYPRKDRIADRIEVRVKLRCDVGTNWEDIGPETWDARSTRPETIVNHYYIKPDRAIGRQIWEVRWNWEGSLQGHYHPGAGHFCNTWRMPSHIKAES